MADFEFSGQALDLSDSITAHLNAHGKDAANSIIQKSDVVLEWLGYLNSHKLTGIGDGLLTGIRSLILESIAATSAGLYRSAILSMRGQIDLSLAWLYFKDHKIEWELVHLSNDGFKLKKEIFEYLAQYIPGYKARWKVLEKGTRRKVSDPFRVLSAHIHGMGESAIPTIAQFADIVGTKEISKDCADLQSDVFCYISDIFLSYYGQDWIALPAAIQKEYKDNFSDGEVAVLGT